MNEINNVLTGNNNWRQDGLGDTGETYLVGEDLRLRSTARLLVENPTGYLDMLRQNRLRAQTVHLIEQMKTSLLLHPIQTDAATEAVQGISGTKIIRGYRGSDVLSFYAPLNIHGVNWGIISEMSLSEAYAPINALQTYLLLLTVVLILLMTLFAAIASQRLMRPIDVMIERSRLVFQGESEVGSGDLNPELETIAQDELGELAQIFNDMASQLRQKTATIAQKAQENEMLLLNILPRPVMER
ncbi:HAMP domain-containing protein [Nostoc sp.]|uniref:HAMP domain-containing protein n=1 Tax=Nostoc sp. TaxID=1180 RepID=UPI002FF954C9